MRDEFSKAQGTLRDLVRVLAVDTGDVRPSSLPLLRRIFASLNIPPLGLDPKRLRLFAGECAKLRNDLAHYGGHPNHQYTFLQGRRPISIAADFAGGRGVLLYPPPPPPNLTQYPPP